MNANEFKARTEKYLSADEINHYEDWYEPAYMATQGIDKDDFCKILKDPTARKFVREVSIAVADFNGRIKDWESRDREAQSHRYFAEQMAAKYRKALLLISATCDRTGATV